MLELDIEHRATRFMKKLPPKHKRQISGKILELLHNPFPPDSKQLKNSMFRGTDIGEYRIAYTVEGNILHVPLIGKRNDGDMYRRLDRLE